MIQFNTKVHFILTILTITIVSCSKKETYDATGTFEADELMITAEANGKILELKLQEGQNLSENQHVGIIDGKGIELQKDQVAATILAIDEKTNSATPQIQVLKRQLQSQKAQIGVLQVQLQTALRERNRAANLVKADAGTQKQLDDANSQVSVIQKQIDVAYAQLASTQQQIFSTKDQISIQNRAILSEKKPTRTKIAQIDDQLKHNRITAPITGIVLTQYMHKGEFATMGKPIFKMANLDVMTLRAYIAGTQLPLVKLGQKVKIIIDAGENTSKELIGELFWISEKAEFTPKTIQTKDERENLVYAVKIKVKNDGFLKIGMYGEVIL